MKLQRRSDDNQPYEGGPLSLREAMGRLFDESIWDPFEERSLLANERQSRNFPKVNISETEDNIKITANIPGIDPENVKVEVEEDSIAISGFIEEEKEDKEESYYRFEREYGEFYRDFLLPAKVDPEKVEAHSKDGVITINLPKTVDKTSKKKIDIKKTA